MVGLYVSLFFSIVLICDVMIFIDELWNIGVIFRFVNKIKRIVMKRLLIDLYLLLFFKNCCLYIRDML